MSERGVIFWSLAIVIGLILLVYACKPVLAAEVRASWYHEGCCVACGGRYHPDGLTAAHRTLPCGTRLRITRGARAVLVRVTDRGPARWTGRQLDLSRGAARQLGMLRVGVSTIYMQPLR